MHEKWPAFIASYRMGEDRYQFEFPARDMADAEARLAAIKAWAKLDGQIYLTVRVPRGLIERLLTWLRRPAPESAR